MQERLTSADFTELLAAENLDPRSKWRDDLMHAQTAASIVNMLRDPKKSNPVKVSDLMPRFGKEEEIEETPIETARRMGLVIHDPDEDSD